MRSEFEIKITTKSMYHFLMYHTYHGMSGIVGLVAGIGLIAYYFLDARKGDVNNPWVFLFFGVLFLVYQPWTLYTKAIKQAQLNPVFKQPLHYILTEQNIEVKQGNASNQITWDQIWMVKESGQSILVYTSEKNAFIWVKSQIKEEEDTVRALLKKLVDPKKVKLKK